MHSSLCDGQCIVTPTNCAVITGQKESVPFLSNGGDPRVFIKSAIELKAK